MPLTVGILCSKERTVRMREFTANVLQRLFHDLTKPILFGKTPSIEVDPHQLRIVVEHLLEVGNQPLAIHRVAVEPAAEMIVNPSGCHGSQLEKYLLLMGVVFRPGRLTEQKAERRDRWKFRSLTESAVDRVEKLP